MNIIIKKPADKIGYGFIESQYLPKGKDEYYLRRTQYTASKKHKKLSKEQIETLIRNHNRSDDWNRVEVTAGFNADLVRNCNFHGWVRIGDLSPMYHEFHNFKMFFNQKRDKNLLKTLKMLHLPKDLRNFLII